MTQSRIVIRPTRNVRDIYMRKRYIVAARSPGGREIIIAKEATKRRAFIQAVGTLSTQQTSPTAGAYGGGGTTVGSGGGGYTGGGGGGGGGGERLEGYYPFYSY